MGVRAAHEDDPTLNAMSCVEGETFSVPGFVEQEIPRGNDRKNCKSNNRCKDKVLHGKEMR